MAPYHRRGPRKRETTLLVLERSGLTSVALKEAIFRRVFPTQKIIEKHLERHHVNLDSAPCAWVDSMDGDFMQCLLAQEGKLEEYGGYEEHDREWLHYTSRVLNLYFKDTGQSYKKWRRDCDVEIPAGWYFDSTRPPALANECSGCDEAIDRWDHEHDKTGALVCKRCYKCLHKKGFA